MAGFLFWKKKRGAEAEAPVEQVETPAEQVETPAEQVEVEIEPAIVEPDVVEEPVVEELVVEEPELEELVAVELPKRSAKKGIRSLFSRIKFNPENLDELEDILIQADFGIDASMAIVDEVKARAKKAGGSDK